MLDYSKSSSLMKTESKASHKAIFMVISEVIQPLKCIDRAQQSFRHQSRIQIQTLTRTHADLLNIPKRTTWSWTPSIIFLISFFTRHIYFPLSLFVQRSKRLKLCLKQAFATCFFIFTQAPDFWYPSYTSFEPRFRTALSSISLFHLQACSLVCKTCCCCCCCACLAPSLASLL